ncbi:pyrimidine 5'-nucleotidase [Camelimonas abortus]|uniref:Pyrimidine 5'-nucleotidase n=1 Tax=Camelimonas abortus TaxID=1017184 RepID=A0ABV7LGM4_9HYPH
MTGRSRSEGAAAAVRRTAAGAAPPAGLAALPGADRIRYWLLDLDDTLYPRSAGLHEQMRRRVVSFIMARLSLDEAAAAALHQAYYARFGATVRGLAQLHGVAPEEFLAHVHAVDLAPLAPNPKLKQVLSALPGRRIIVTNSPRAHAERVLAALGVADAIDGIVAIEDSAYRPKPDAAACEACIRRHGVAPERALMADDRLMNLRAPAALGMRTLLVDEDGVSTGQDAGFTVDATARSLVSFLTS